MGIQARKDWHVRVEVYLKLYIQDGGLFKTRGLVRRGTIGRFTILIKITLETFESQQDTRRMYAEVATTTIHYALSRMRVFFLGTISRQKAGSTRKLRYFCCHLPLLSQHL